MHPSGSYMAAIDNTYRLNLHETATGAMLGRVPTSTIAPLIDHPFWSPIGDQIVFVATSTPGSEGVLSVEEGTIWTMDFSTATGTPTFSNPRMLVGPDTAGGNAYYPAYSPDGEWIVFCRAASGQSYNNTGATLWLIKSDGSVGPIRLDNANRGINLANSWPRWAPRERQGTYWIVFSSERQYPVFNGGGPQQLWVTRIDVNNIPGDPSAPAIWLEGQFAFTGNLTAEWSATQ